jgi:hypothetical protein
MVCNAKPLCQAHKLHSQAGNFKHNAPMYQVASVALKWGSKCSNPIPQATVASKTSTHCMQTTTLHAALHITNVPGPKLQAAKQAPAVVHKSFCKSFWQQTALPNKQAML